ncbi:hypothetical protein [Kaarinaea lacus]
MTHINMSNNVYIEIYESDGFYANISLYDKKHIIGPEYDLAVLNKSLFDFLNSFRNSAESEESRESELEALQLCLMNCQLEEYEYP